jgi:hypothetical protein
VAAIFVKLSNSAVNAYIFAFVMFFQEYICFLNVLIKISNLLHKR